MNIAIGTANVTYLSPADLRRLFSEVLSPTSSLLDLTSTSFKLRDSISQNYIVAKGSGIVFDVVTQSFTDGTITLIDFFEGVSPVVSFVGLQIDAAIFYTSLSDSSVPNPLYDDYAFNVLGSTGNDTLYGGDGTLNETFNGSDGIDTLTHEDAAFGGVTVNLQASTGIKPGGGVDTISNIENVTGSDQADVLTGYAAVNVLSGGAGNDNIYGTRLDTFSPFGALLT